MKVVPMLQVASIPAASQWYQDVLGLVSGHGGDEYEMLFAGEPCATALLIQLHRWDAHEHGFMGRSDLPIGNGSSLWFEVEDAGEFEARWRVATAAGVSVLAAPAWNPLAHHHEFSIRDLDGYVVVVHTPFEPDGPSA